MNFKACRQRDVALAFGVTPATISNWSVEGMPRNGDKSYDLPSCIKWREERIRDELTARGDGDTDGWLDHYRKERALITQMTREQMEKKLVAVEAVEAGFSDRAYELSRRLLLMSRRIGQRLAGKSKRLYNEVCDVIDVEVRSAMNDYARPMVLEVEPLKK